MTSRERVLTALAHREPDRVPWGEHSVDFNIVEEVLGRKTLYHAKIYEHQAWWEGRREEIVRCYVEDYPTMAEALGFDILTVQRLPSRREPVKPMIQVDAETYRDEAGNLYRVSCHTHELSLYQKAPREPEVPTPESLHARIEALERDGLPEPDESVWDMVRPIMAKYHNTHFIALLGGGIGWPSFGDTPEEFFTNLAAYPDLHPLLAELQGKTALADLRHCARTGVDAVLNCVDYGTTRALAARPGIFRDHVYPWIKRYCAEVHRLGLKVILHSCGNIWQALDMIVDAGYDAYESIQSGAGMDLRRLKERYGDRITLWGGVTNENLLMGKPEDIIADAQYALKWTAPGGGFIYGASHSLAVGTRAENLMAMKACREKYGRYPIAL